MSEYGEQFDDLLRRWMVIEDEHDRHHPDRGDCGGVGGCSMMFAAVGLQQEAIDALNEWRAARNGGEKTPHSDQDESPAVFVDGGGDSWTRHPDGYYYLYSAPGRAPGWTLVRIREEYGPQQ